MSSNDKSYNWKFEELDSKKICSLVNKVENKEKIRKLTDMRICLRMSQIFRMWSYRNIWAESVRNSFVIDSWQWQEAYLQKWFNHFLRKIWKLWGRNQDGQLWGITTSSNINKKNSLSAFKISSHVANCTVNGWDIN